LKYTIEGFSQVESIRLGLDVKDLVLLRWIVDFYNTGCMDTHLFQGIPFFWIKYEYVLRELPVLGITSKDVLARRMKDICKSGLLEGRIFEAAGHKTYFRFNKDILRSLLSSTEAQGWLFDPVGGGSDLKVGRISTQKSEGYRPKSRNHVDSSINDSSIKDKKAKFIPPTLDEVKAYCRERKNDVDPEKLFYHYKANGWVQGNQGKPVVDWKACVITWEKPKQFDQGKGRGPAVGSSVPSSEKTDKYLKDITK